MMKSAIIITLFLGLLVPQMIEAACPNGCSGNGKCGKNDRCTCHQNWQGPDCSLRTCTFTLAWVDTALGNNDAHYYAECGNKGACDRKTGECKCFDGYEGKGCRRSTCPEGCSGHGTCEYIEELAQDWHDYINGPKYDVNAAHTANAANTKDYTARADALSYTYDAWDTQKIQGCKCDLGYTGADCASRLVPKGDDPLTTDQGVNQKQRIVIGKETTADWDTNNQFFLVYHGPYGGVWRTSAIDVATVAGAAANVDQDTTAASTQAALRNLPNKVLDGVTVTGIADATNAAQNFCLRSQDGDQESTCSYVTSIQQKGAWQLVMDVQFQSKPGQTGVQFLLEVDYRAHNSGEKGFFPQSEGVTAAHQGLGYSHEVLTAGTTNGGASGEDILTELEDCSGRGLDDGEGQCECFEGFRGLACEYQEALV